MKRIVALVIASVFAAMFLGGCLGQPSATEGNSNVPVKHKELKNKKLTNDFNNPS